MHNNSFKSFISALHDDEVLDSKSLDKLEEYFKNLKEEEPGRKKSLRPSSQTLFKKFSFISSN